MTAGVLYIVATPIGNLADITLRAIQILSEVDLIAAEDTRHSRKLLQHYQINTTLISLHEHNEHARTDLLLNYLRAGKNIALISDAGTPLISDPGYTLVQKVRAAGIKVVTIPGACAAIAALSIAGLPTERFAFEGFLPAKASARQTYLQSLKNESRTLIFYEAPHRIVDLISDIRLIFGADRNLVIAKELTKTFETIYSGNADTVSQWLSADPDRQKGEFVVLVRGADLKPNDNLTAETQHLLTILLTELPLKQAIHLASRITGEKRNDLYKLALLLKDNYE